MLAACSVNLVGGFAGEPPEADRGACAEVHRLALAALPGHRQETVVCAVPVGAGDHGPADPTLDATQTALGSLPSWIWLPRALARCFDAWNLLRSCTRALNTALVQGEASIVSFEVPGPYAYLPERVISLPDGQFKVRKQ